MPVKTLDSSRIGRQAQTHCTAWNSETLTPPQKNTRFSVSFPNSFRLSTQKRNSATKPARRRTSVKENRKCIATIWPS